MTTPTINPNLIHDSASRSNNLQPMQSSREYTQDQASFNPDIPDLTFMANSTHYANSNFPPMSPIKEFDPLTGPASTQLNGLVQQAQLLQSVVALTNENRSLRQELEQTQNEVFGWMSAASNVILRYISTSIKQGDYCPDRDREDFEMFIRSIGEGGQLGSGSRVSGSSALHSKEN
ncbi:hypothetical protein BDV97DRAFT_349570 [Delphinella strobiligena]|nr:hypothetical protein BDV97DRAFT_349570 [Delphinella strobiligena]